jgi:hypothetical protein
MGGGGGVRISAAKMEGATSKRRRDFMLFPGI